MEDLKNNKIDSVEKYEFEPIKGYPMLNWKGKRPFTSTQYYPAQLKEEYGEEKDGWKNEIYWGDNLQVMSHMLKEYRGKVDLIYIDPPFDSKADYKKTIKLRGEKIQTDSTNFEEKQYTDIWTNDEYLQFMYERLIILKELLSDKGVFCFHCDWHKSAYLRLMLDEIFGKENFLNEIIWKYESGGIPEYFFAQKHDNIYVYVKSKNYTFNKQEASVPRNICQSCGQAISKWNNLRKEVDENGRIYRTIKSNGKIYKYYDDEPILLSDVWVDISHIQQKDPQRLDYPTQKPEKLLSRLINVFSNKGDLVFDCFMGSGTTQAVAMKLGRRFIGADINMGAVDTTVKRVLSIAQESSNDENIYKGLKIYNVNNYEIFRNPVEAKKLLIDALEIQPMIGNDLYDGEQDGYMVKILPVNRIATKADLNELISNFPYNTFDKRKNDNPHEPVEHIRLVCMGHEPNLGSDLVLDMKEMGYNVDVEVVDILRDKANLEFKRDSEAEIVKESNKLVVRNFYPMNLLQKLSVEQQEVENWRVLVDSIKIDFHYDGVIFSPTVVDVPGKDELVKGIYEIPNDVSDIRIKITDLLSESFEETIK